MARSRLVSGIVVGLFLLSGCGKPEFKEFTSTEGRFKVLMPGTPTEKTETASGVTMKIFSVEGRNGAYAVAFADMPIPAGESEAQIHKRLNGARDGAVANVKGLLKTETKITLSEKHLGREFEASLPEQKGMLRARIYLVNQRLYQIMVVGKPEWTSSSEATKFLESFTLTSP
jgi:hypothetical protein